MADVVVAGPLGGAGQHREHRCGAVEGLDLGLLVHAEHQRPLGRVEVEPDDVADLVDEQRVLGQLPGILFVRGQPERPPDPRDRRLRQPQVRGHRPRRPVRGVLAARSPRWPVISFSIWASPTIRGRPGRGSSTSPSRRCSANRLRHRRTVRDRQSQPCRPAQCWTHHRLPPTRFAPASPAPPHSSAAAPTPPTRHAHQRSTRSQRHAE